MNGILPRRVLSFVLVVVAACASTAIVACSGDDHPAVLEAKDASGLTKDVVSGEPCETPATGCPCVDAGAEEYCGVIYRVVGNHVDCAKGYMKCGPDGTWGTCEGPTVYGAE